MYIPTLLSIFALPLAVECQNWWNTIIEYFNAPVVPEDAHLNISQLLHKYGYEFEDHRVATQDKYFIQFHRIPNPNRPVVFLMHGITESSDCWLLQGPSLSLGYILVDEGYDVWLGNARGNKYSNEHGVWNNTSEEFWKFTWEEIGMYDLSAMIDYILRYTKKEDLYYIGHSQGTTSDYVLLSMKPEYNDKIKLMFSLAPEAWMGNVRSTVITTMASFAGGLLPYLDYGIFTSGTNIFNKVSTLLCSWSPQNCDNLFYALIGPKHKINETLWSVIFGHMPTGSSTLQLLHYGQLVNSKRFCRFDHGKDGNIARYGQETPPDYNLTNIVTPVVLFYSDGDYLSDPKDVKILITKLPNVLEAIFLKDFGHIDYLYAAEAKSAVYDRIVKQIRKFDSVV